MHMQPIRRLIAFHSHKAMAPTRHVHLLGKQRRVDGMNAVIFAAALFLAAYPVHAAHADDATEQQLRAALQQATTQIAQLEDQVANLQAQQAPSQALIASLQAELHTLKQGGNTAQTPASSKQLTELQHEVVAQQAALGKAAAAYNQAATIANSNAAANQQLTAQLTALKTQQHGCEVKNAELYQTGNAILDQLAHRDDFWSSLASREPFIGFERVKLQNIVQDDQDKLDDNQILSNSAGQGTNTP